MDLVAWEGAIVVGADAATDDASSVAGKAGGPLSLRGETGVRVLPGASATCVDGDLRLDAASGAVEIRGEVSSRFGAVEVRSRDGVRVDAGVSGSPSVSGTRVALSASADGVEVAAGSLRAKAGPLSILASADVGLATSASAAGDLSIVSTGGAVRVGGATLATDAALDASGSILVESWDEEAGGVEADGSTMTTGDAIATSGDISLLVHAPAAGPGDPGPSSPAALRILGAAARGAGSGSWKVKVSGGLADLEAMGPAGGSAQVEVCGEVRELLPVGRTDGRTLRFAGTDGRLRIRLPRGEGEARVRLSWRGGLGGALDAGGTGALRVRFRACGLDAEGEAGLRAGRMR